MNNNTAESKASALRTKIINTLLENKVVILFVVLCIVSIMLSDKPLTYITGELFTRITRNGFLVLSLLIPVLAGMGMNFGIVIGAIAAQIAVFWVVYWGKTGLGGFALALIIATPLAIVFGWLVGRLFNKMKGTEMMGGMILSFFADGLYQLFFLFIIGGVIPVDNPGMIIQGGIGVKNTIDLKDNLKYALDTVPMVTILRVLTIAGIIILLSMLFYRKSKGMAQNSVRSILYSALCAVVLGLTFVAPITEFLSVQQLTLRASLYIVMGVCFTLLLIRFLTGERSDADKKKMLINLITAAVILALSFIPAIVKILVYVKIPAMTYLCIGGLCIFNNALMKTRLGQNMRTVGQSRTVANASGINVDKTRIIAMILSTVLASWGQLIYLQNLGTFATYGAHTQVGQFAIAALLVGGATIQNANNKQAIIGIILFHTLFITAPLAGNHLFGSPQIGEYFRVFITYGVIAASLAMHAWKTVIKPKDKAPEQPALTEESK